MPSLVSRRALLLGSAVAMACSNRTAPVDASVDTSAPDAPFADAGTGAYAIATDSGVTWLVAPNGGRTISLGVNHLEPNLWLRNYNAEASIKRYGTDFANNGKFNASGEGAKKWIDGALSNLQKWGFNALGFHSVAPEGLTAGSIGIFAAMRPISVTPYVPNLEYPDVFSDEVAGVIDEGARVACEKARNDSNILGYIYNDRPLYNVMVGKEGLELNAWIVTLLRLDAAKAGKKAWIALLQSRYATASAAAAAHAANATTWDALASLTSWSTQTLSAEAIADHTAFLTQIIERWYQLQHDAVRKYDPVHLIFGDKLGGGTAQSGYRGTSHPQIPAYMLPVLAKYVDVVTVEWYGYFDDQVAALRAIHAATGKPILLGDSCFSEIQPDQAGAAKGVHVDSQEAVGDAYATYLRAALAEPYIIGWHFCGYIESWPVATDQFQPQNGFIDPFEVVHDAAVAKVTVANGQAVAWHKGG